MDVGLITSVGLILGTVVLIQQIVSRVRGKSHPNGPPCLPSWPIVGSLLYMPRDYQLIPEFYMKTAEKLGSIFAYYTGSRYTVVLNGKDAYVAALVRNSVAFAGREAFYQEKHYGNRNLKGFSSKPFGKEYKFNHAVVLSILKEFGLGKGNSMELRILLELEHCIDTLKKKNGMAFNPHSLLGESLSNVIVNVVLGKRFEYGDNKLDRLARYPREYLENMSLDLDVVPMARFLPSYRKQINKACEVTRAWYELLGKEIAETLERSAGNSLVEMYVDKAGPDYDREELMYIVRDFLMAGSDPLVVTLRWVLLMLANHPQVQESLQEEIDSVVPSDRLPSMDDKKNLPKVEAAYMEVMRWKTIVPLCDMRITTTDVEVKGLFIPADTLVIPNIWSVNMDPKEFPEPEKFKLERFLDDEGKVYGSDRTVSFSLGRRSCIGEVMSRQEIFTFMAGILQHFHVLPPEGQKSIEVGEFYHSMLTPLPFDIRFVPRK